MIVLRDDDSGRIEGIPEAVWQFAVSGYRLLPWKERDARMWQIVFPNMANWLPDEEANQLRFAFAKEIERLKLAA